MTLAKFLRTGAAALGALAVATQANAADIYSGGGLKDQPAPPPPLWTGFYAGINLGAAWTDYNNKSNEFYDYDSTWSKYSNGPLAFGGKGLDTVGAFGGGQLGYNWQPYGWSNWVLGIEVDLEGVGDDNQRTYLPDGTVTWKGNTYTSSFNAIKVETSGGFAGDVTGRLGYAWGPALIYAKGGFAWLESNTSMNASGWDWFHGSAVFANGATSATYNNDTTLTGYTVGAGIEWLLNPNWSVKIEYLHFDFSGDNNNWNPGYCYDPTGKWDTWKFKNDVQVDTVKLGINYHLISYPAPLK